MENRSFGENSTIDNPSENPKDNLPGPSDENQQDIPSEIPRKPPKSIRSYIPSSGRPIDDKYGDESPPAYVKRYMPPEKKIDDLESLEYPAPEPVQEPHDVSLDPELQQQARNRRARRARQQLVEGPCSLRPDSPNQAPLPEPEPYPDQDQQRDSAPVPTTAPPTWPGRFLGMYRSLGVFSFQFPFHTLLLTWPLATAAMGALNLNGCQLNLFLPYVMMAVGFLGTIATTFRLYTLYFEKRLTNVNTETYWIGVRFAEAIVWVFFGAQLIYFFKQNPSFTPGDKHYCKWRYYKVNCVLMSLSSVMMLGWIIVHSIKLAQWLLAKLPQGRRNEPTRT